MSSGSASESPRHRQRKDGLCSTKPRAELILVAPQLQLASDLPFLISQPPFASDPTASVSELPQIASYRSASFDLSSLSNWLIPPRAHDYHLQGQPNEFPSATADLVFRPHSPAPSQFTDLRQAGRPRSMIGGEASSTRRNPQVVQPRQIRFVPNDGLPHAKRRRINAACQTCRKRKTRCSGERPVCKTCTDNSHECLGYAGPAQQHQRKPSAATTGDDEDDEGWNSSTQARVGPSSTPSRTHDHPSPDGALASPRSIQSSRSSNTSPQMTRRSPANPRKQDSDISEGRSPASNATARSNSARNRVPYFRYFGPTAIVPGFKQMVVSMKGPRLSHADHGAFGASPAISWAGPPGLRTTPSLAGSDVGASVEIPFYHVNDPGQISPLITHLCETFFIHLGCNYPFLQRERFLGDLEEKRVDTILVDAVCALGARFSNHPLLVTPTDQSVELDNNREVQRAFRGHPFAQRAMSAVADTFAYPTVAVVQACLLLAYEEFGANHDSGLWMYLGTSIRMAQDIGMHKLEGLRLEGRVGPTPKTVKRGSAGSNEESERAEEQRSLTRREEEEMRREAINQADNEMVSLDDRRANERERIDTFYGIFFLDRVVSSGVGRPVTLRDKDIEISFPFRPDEESMDGWPAPFPPLIRIIHLYGRVTDVLNGIKDAQEVTPDTLKRLAGMEKDLTSIYQALSSKLHFNAVNFQHYVRAEQGTNFILLHFWFHTLIVLLHQPTLLHSFGGKIQQLFPDSRELSMSSAKTIADILAFAELIDAKSFIGNPFTSQPMYIAACAFLAEMTTYSSVPSTPSSSTTESASTENFKGESKKDNGSVRATADKKLSARTSLLATAANQNYQRCYEALKALERYWAGTRYILTALDQKSKGIMDPLLYTIEDIESSIELPRTIPAFLTPGWRRSVAHSYSFSYPNASRRPRHDSNNFKVNGSPPTMDPSQAIGWSLTGTMNSPNPNLSFLYSNPNTDPTEPASLPQTQLSNFVENQSFGNQVGNIGSESLYSYHATDGNMLPPSNSLQQQSDRLSDAGLLLGLHSPGAISNPTLSDPTQASNFATSTFQSSPNPQLFQQPAHASASNVNLNLTQPNLHYTGNLNVGPASLGDMMIESQDIDMSNQAGGLAFPAGEVIPWLEYLPQDVLSWFGDPDEAANNQQPRSQNRK